MSSNIINEDLRSRKTKKALYGAMFSLLRNLSFRKMTIKEICEKALISRAAFYTHFIDKYDLLKHWMAEVWPQSFDSYGTYEQIEKEINRRIHENMSVLKNIMDEADNETIDILFDCILSTINLSIEKSSATELYPKNIVLSHFYAGGILSYLSWQVKNRFPPDVPPVNRYFYEMIQGLQDFQSNKKKVGDGFNESANKYDGTSQKN